MSCRVLTFLATSYLVAIFIHSFIHPSLLPRHLPTAKMQLSFATFFLTLAVAVGAVPVEVESRAAATCGSQYYTAAQVNAASVRACSHFRAGTQVSTYPHRYNNYEGFRFGGVPGPYQEFPIRPSGLYTGG